MRAMLRDPLAYLVGCRDRYGPVVAFPLPRTPALLVNDPAGAHRVLVDNARAYSKRTVQYDTLALVTGQGLLVSDPPVWLRHRRQVQPAFHHDRLPGVVAHTVDAAGRALADWAVPPGGRTVDVDAAMMRTTLEVVGAALFSTDLSGSAAGLVDAVLTALDRVVVRARSPWLPPVGVPTPGNLRLRRALATLDATVAAMVLQRRRRGEHPDDMLGLLLAPGPDGDPDPALVRDEVVTTLIAGHETVASALTWTCHLLGRHPDVQRRVQAEVDAVLGGAPPTYADLGRLTYTRAVLDETLRLYPPAWVISRRAMADDVVCGAAVPAGALVLVSPYVVHRDPAAWEHPLRFDPDRWLDHRRAGLPRGAYLPFGAGQRLCIGRDVALVEAVVLLAVTAQAVTLSPVPGRAVRADALVTIRPAGGLPMRMTPRTGRRVRT